MARGKNQEDSLLDETMDQELAAAFLDDDTQGATIVEEAVTTEGGEAWEDAEAAMPGTLAIDAYETEDRLVIKARTAGVNKQDLDVSISDGILTISGTLSSGNEEEIQQWHIQECYWGEFSRTLALPVPIKEDEVEAVLKDGVLTISFVKIKQEQARRIQIQ
jgi:HSP20 family protein